MQHENVTSVLYAGLVLMLLYASCRLHAVYTCFSIIQGLGKVARGPCITVSIIKPHRRLETEMSQMNHFRCLCVTSGLIFVFMS